MACRIEPPWSESGSELLGAGNPLTETDSVEPGARHDEARALAPGVDLRQVLREEVQRGMVAYGEPWESRGPLEDPAVDARPDRGMEPAHLGLGQLQEVALGQVGERRVERAAEERGRQGETLGDSTGEERGEIEDTEGPEPLAARDQDAESVR